MIQQCSVIGNGFGIEDISEDRLTRRFWHFDVSHYIGHEKINIYLIRYAPQTRPTTKHKWVYPVAAGTSYDRWDNRYHYNRAGMPRAAVPLPLEVERLAIEIVQGMVEMESSDD